MPNVLRYFLIIFFALNGFSYGKDFYELPPINYSEAIASNPVALLSAQVQSGEKAITATSTLEFLRWLLKELHVPEESQILVFSKTSLQIGLISPQTPRALYFNDDVYVGYVPGGIIEIAVNDSVLGMAFYGVDFRKKKAEVFSRETACLSCHATTRTEGVPGVFVRSVYPDVGGQPLGNRGSFLANDLLEMEHRWGGYYVTGKGPGVQHLGNRTYEERGEIESTEVWHDSLKGVVSTTNYLQSTSDIQAIMLLEHQTRVHNVLIETKLNYIRSVYLSKALHPEATVDVANGPLANKRKRMVDKLLTAMLFKGEARIGGDGMQGDKHVEEVLLKSVPKNARGRSLKDMRLRPRLMRCRLSYMIYSNAFQELPALVKKQFLDRLKEILREKAENETFHYLSKKERKRIDAILRETLPIWNKEAA